eukprot:1141976-Pelagomonas_calceolata.AAC.3
MARAREYAKSLSARGAAAAARNRTSNQSMVTSMAQSVASSHPVWSSVDGGGRTDGVIADCQAFLNASRLECSRHF